MSKKEGLIRQIDSENWLQTILQQNIPSEKWNIEPDIIFEQYNQRIIDKETAIYVLKILFHNFLPFYYKLGKIKKIISYICDLSKKNEELKLYLEEIFVTEVWIPLRLFILEKIHQYFPDFVFKLFNIIQYEEKERFFQQILNDFKGINFDFIKDFINNPLILFYLELKKRTKSYVKLMIGYSYNKHYIKLGYDNISTIQYHPFEPYKRSKRLKEFNGITIFQNLTAFFVKDGSIADKNQTPFYIFDEKKRLEMQILYIRNKKPFLSCYTINKELLISIIESIDELYGIDNKDLEFQLESTANNSNYLMLKLKNQKIPFSLKYKLSQYHLFLKKYRDDYDYYSFSEQEIKRQIRKGENLNKSNRKSR